MKSSDQFNCVGWVDVGNEHLPSFQGITISHYKHLPWTNQYTEGVTGGFWFWLLLNCFVADFNVYKNATALQGSSNTWMSHEVSK